MTIKVQCDCGARYSFEVEPVNGQMPHTVECPVCHADGTAAANKIIAETSGHSTLRMQTAVVEEPPEMVPEAEASPPPVARPSRGASLEKIRVEARRMRMILWLGAGVGLVILALVGAWIWFSFVGSKPHLAFSLKLPGPKTGWHMGILDSDKVLLASADRVILRNFRTDKELWSTPLSDKPADSTEGDGAPPQYCSTPDSIWVCTGGRVLRLDRVSGQVKQTIQIAGQFVSFTPTESSLVIVSASDETQRRVTQIDLASGGVASRDIVVPRSEKHQMPDELPSNVQPTAGVLLAQANEEQKFNKPLTAISSEFIPAGQNLVELRVKLLEPKVVWVQSIKPRGPSLINGNLTAATAPGGVEEEVFNDIKRDRTGGVKGIDESRYEVKLRRWIGEKPVEWTGEVNGVPVFFPLQTVDLLTAGKSLIVFDKENKKLFEAKLNYPVSDRFLTDNPTRAAPAVENAGQLYFFDQGVLTAFGLPDGAVRWRLTSIGISRVQLDGQNNLYVDSTAAAPEDVQYSEQIKFDRTPPVILKVDSSSGKILWQTQNRGQRCFLSGKYVYTSAAQQGGMALTSGLGEALNAPPAETTVYFRIRRLDPSDGHEIWQFYREQAPDEMAFQQNWFLLRFGDELKAWQFLTF